MEENNGEGSSGVPPTAGEEGTFRRMLAKYNSTRESITAVTPKIVKVIELVLAIVLILGTAYWAYAYLVVGA